MSPFWFLKTYISSPCTLHSSVFVCKLKVVLKIHGRVTFLPTTACTVVLPFISKCPEEAIKKTDELDLNHIIVKSGIVFVANIKVDSSNTYRVMKLTFKYKAFTLQDTSLLVSKIKEYCCNYAFQEFIQQVCCLIKYQIFYLARLYNDIYNCSKTVKSKCKFSLTGFYTKPPKYEYWNYINQLYHI